MVKKRKGHQKASPSDSLLVHEMTLIQYLTNANSIGNPLSSNIPIKNKAEISLKNFSHFRTNEQNCKSFLHSGQLLVIPYTVTYYSSSYIYVANLAFLRLHLYFSGFCPYSHSIFYGCILAFPVYIRICTCFSTVTSLLFQFLSVFNLSCMGSNADDF